MENLSLPDFFWRWGLEMTAGGLVAVALVIAYFGQRRNVYVASQWFEEVRDIMQQQFATLGFDDCYLRSRGWSVFELYAGGRTGCPCLVATLTCAPRQCFWQYCVALLTGHAADTLELFAVIDKMPSCAVVVGKSSAVRDFLEENDVMKLVVSNKRKSGDRRHCCFSDSTTIAGRLYREEMRHPCLNFLAISDLEKNPRYPDQKFVLHASMSLPSVSGMQTIREPFQNVLSTIDTISNFQMNDKGRMEVLNSREIIEKMKNEERMEQRKNVMAERRQLKAAEEADHYEKLSTAEKRKYEMKQQKKQSKKNTPRMKVIKA